VAPEEVAERVARLTALTEELMAQRAEDRLGEVVEVLVEGPADDEDPTAGVVGRAAHQGPDVDGVTLLPGVAAAPGEVVTARVAGSEGVDLVAEPVAAGAAEVAGVPAGAAGSSA
jgi:tRNA A37 methylthiotransferase MiaB